MKNIFKSILTSLVLFSTISVFAQSSIIRTNYLIEPVLPKHLIGKSGGVFIFNLMTGIKITKIGTNLIVGIQEPEDGYNQYYVIHNYPTNNIRIGDRLIPNIQYIHELTETYYPIIEYVKVGTIGYFPNETRKSYWITHYEYFKPTQFKTNVTYVIKTDTGTITRRIQ